MKPYWEIGQRIVEEEQAGKADFARNHHYRLTAVLTYFKSNFDYSNMLKIPALKYVLFDFFEIIVDNSIDY